MSKRDKTENQGTAQFEKARDELFRQIIHCGVLSATEDQRDEWLKNTMDYIAKRYPSVDGDQLAELDAAGRRYCEPVRGYGGDGEEVGERIG